MDTKEPENLKKIPFLNNMVVADPNSIGIMKLGVMQHRTTHRDYYDVYSLLQSGISLESLINGVRRFSKYNFKTREIESLLVNGAHFTEDKQFLKLQPKYDVTLKDIEMFMIERIKEIHHALPCKASEKSAAICKEVKTNKKMHSDQGSVKKNVYEKES
jgi:hypothetical protein